MAKIDNRNMQQHQNYLYTVIEDKTFVWKTNAWNVYNIKLFRFVAFWILQAYLNLCTFLS